MEQLELSLTPKLSYEAGSFVVHAGVRQLCDTVVSAVTRNHFSLFYINGEPRSGKTHFAVWAAGEAAASGKIATLLEGKDFGKQLSVAEASNAVVIDDIDQYFLHPEYSHSGAFVHFVERLRVRKSVLILLSRKCPAELPVDEHVASRLIPGKGHFVNAPAEEDLLKILSVMALQRGIMLQERKRKFLLARLSRDIGSIERFLDRVREISSGQEKAVRYSLLRKAMTL